jgi:hypothetical protein
MKSIVKWIVGRLEVLDALVARLGQSIQFVAFVAHCFVAAAFVEHAPGRGEFWTLFWFFFVLVAGALKEYLYDAREEHDPPQTWLDNTEDFIGFALGAMLGLHWRLHALAR